MHPTCKIAVATLLVVVASAEGAWSDDYLAERETHGRAVVREMDRLVSEEIQAVQTIQANGRNAGVLWSFLKRAQADKTFAANLNGPADEERRRAEAALVGLQAAGVVPADFKLESALAEVKTLSGDGAQGDALKGTSPTLTYLAGLASAGEAVSHAYAAAGSAVLSRRALELTRLTDMGFSLRRGLEKAAEAEGAQLAVTHDFDDSSNNVLSTEFCLKWTRRADAPSAAGTLRLQPMVAALGKLRTEDADHKNYWSVRAGLEADLKRDARPWQEASRKISRWHGKLLGSYWRSQDGDIEKAMADLLVQPLYGPWALGVRRGHETLDPRNPSTGIDPATGCCTPGRNLVSWQLLAQGGASVGWTLEEGDSKEVEDEILRGRLQVGGRLYFDGLARWLGKGWNAIEYPYLDASLSLYVMPLEADEMHSVLTLTLKLPLNKLVSLQATYTNGDPEPSFQHTEQLELSLAFGF